MTPAERKRAWAKVNYARNRDAIRAQQAEYYKRNSEFVKERTTANSKKPEYKERKNAKAREKFASDSEYREYMYNKDRARRQSIVNELEPGEWLKMVEHVNNSCLSCSSSPVTKDHVIPVCFGGRHHVSNIQPLCLKCNSSKGTKSTDYRPSDWPWLDFSAGGGQTVPDLL